MLIAACRESAGAATVRFGAATVATECPNLMSGRPRRFSFLHEGRHEAAVKPELHGIPIDRARRLPHYADWLRRGRFLLFGRIRDRFGEWKYIEPETAQALHRHRAYCWKCDGAEVWCVHAHDAVGVPRHLALDLYGNLLPWQSESGWLDREIEAGRLVWDGELVRQPPPPISNWPGATSPAARRPAGRSPQAHRPRGYSREDFAAEAQRFKESVAGKRGDSIRAYMIGWVGDNLKNRDGKPPSDPWVDERLKDLGYR
jgi:hypothetical protein